ncbi:penicillin-binding transpeptidase domain-containing protein, partial [Treponema porcinum]|uniref:penicillin-binding transpeptidase domain-containing protein n=1 Tax=Treponema porcinum TaxID=261392 RepID=UPI0023F4DB0D
AKIRALGFGQRTEIELPGETYGSVKDSDSALWSVRSKPTIAIGQEISVSALQMVQAATVIANKGIPLKLTLVKRITNKDGSVFYEHTAVPKERVLKQSTAEYVLSCMETTATSGTGSRARLNDISLGVKTGTAQMASKSGGYSTTDFLSNCMAIFPVEDPQIILYIVVEKAKGETYAGRIVAPVIAKAADEIIDYLGMSRGDAASLEHSGKISISAARPIILGKKLPDFTGLSKRDIMNLVNSNGIQVKINGSGWVKSQNPAPGTPVTENMIIELNLE